MVKNAPPFGLARSSTVKIRLRNYQKPSGTVSGTGRGTTTGTERGRERDSEISLLAKCAVLKRWIQHRVTKEKGEFDNDESGWHKTVQDCINARSSREQEGQVNAKKDIKRGA